MKLKTINSKSIKVGYGNRQGYITTRIYQCPCGEGTITYEIDDITGYKNRDVHCDCSDCNEKYTFKRDGIAEEK